MSRVPVRPHARHKGLAPALGLALAVVALFAVSLVGIVLSLWLVVNAALQLYVDAMNL